MKNIARMGKLQSCKLKTIEPSERMMKRCNQRMAPYFSKARIYLGQEGIVAYKCSSHLILVKYPSLTMFVVTSFQNVFR